MSALAVEPGPARGSDWDATVRLWEETDAPEGSKVEIIEGIVTLAPPPSEEHNDAAELVTEILWPARPEGCGIYQTLGLIAADAEGLYIPDLCVVPRAALRERRRVQAAEAELVVEITSQSNANHDRVKKAHGYAKAGVPLYLLLDPWHSGRPTATLYGEPANGTYRVLDSVEYGEELRLPAPFDVTLDTNVLPLND
ncbi:Uma2 family endonuclease [Streptomyces sp. VRA16 Mangrove soil]|uniref:Uma2 family endonuclease n=1 Tax=Streptomyces sp. VRA16 Mangrove soil TaxID=2817434 RepID=UPI001A9CFA26|nr:Uma2 family endonuclease [Streptomyces sp. VRA16 Mangrove soil]MBO1334789.1 Uma2 family endonuclease [Streptomyces sp. VRA16 Mangrove soil]